MHKKTDQEIEDIVNSSHEIDKNSTISVYENMSDSEKRKVSTIIALRRVVVDLKYLDDFVNNEFCFSNGDVSNPVKSNLWEHPTDKDFYLKDQPLEKGSMMTLILKENQTFDDLRQEAIDNLLSLKLSIDKLLSVDDASDGDTYRMINKVLESK
jgi:hypothetical protein